MLDRGRFQPFELAGGQGAGLVEIADRDAGRALELRRDAGQVGAGFLVLAHLGGGLEDFRIGQPHRAATFGGSVDHREAQHHANLRRGETDAGHRLHRVDHVGPDRADLVGHRRDRVGGGAQATGGIGNAEPDGHAGPLA